MQREMNNRTTALTEPVKVSPPITMGQRATYVLSRLLTSTMTAAPMTGPNRVPAPPSTTIRMPSVEGTM